jgi:hypothetical protein
MIYASFFVYCYDVYGATHSLCIIYDCGACEHFSRCSEKEKSVFAGSAYRSINQLMYEGDNQLNNNITPMRNSFFALCGGLFIYRDVKVALGFFLSPHNISRGRDNKT